MSHASCMRSCARLRRSSSVRSAWSSRSQYPPRLPPPLGLDGTVAVLALTVMLAAVLIGFLMLAIRHEAVSQIIGLLVLENGVRLGAQILIPGMPLLIELMILADVLAAVACLSVLVRYLLSQFGTASTAELKRLVG